MLGPQFGRYVLDGDDHRARQGMTFGQELPDAPSAGHWPAPEDTRTHGEYTLGYWPGSGRGVAAFHGETPVAKMQVRDVYESRDRLTPMVGFVNTSREHRRRGLATAMWEFAQEKRKGQIVHDPTRTPEGQAWASTVGGRTLGDARKETT